MSSSGPLAAGWTAQPSPFPSLVTCQAVQLVRSAAHLKEAFDGREDESEGWVERPKAAHGRKVTMNRNQPHSEIKSQENISQETSHLSFSDHPEFFYLGNAVIYLGMLLFLGTQSGIFE